MTASSDTDKVAFMNDAINILSPYFSKAVRTTIDTIANTDEYALPTGCTDVSQIVSLGMPTQTTPSNRYDYNYYSKAVAEYPMQGNSYFQVVTATGVKRLVIYPVPQTSGYPMSIIYNKPISELSATVLTATPEFDEAYHILLVYYACKMLATAGSAPDTTQSDMFTKLWDDGLDELYGKKMHEQIMHTSRRRDNRQWHNGRKHTDGSAV